jgi:hypothetical protein
MSGQPQTNPATETTDAGIELEKLGHPTDERGHGNGKFRRIPRCTVSEIAQAVTQLAPAVIRLVPAVTEIAGWMTELAGAVIQLASWIIELEGAARKRIFAQGGLLCPNPAGSALVLGRTAGARSPLSAPMPAGPCRKSL